MKSTRLNPFQVLRDQWAIMSFYERFEQVIALVLSAVIAVIIVVSLLQLISIVFTLLILDAFNPLDHKVFQTVFGMIMTLLIAMEFKHSIVRVALRRDSIIQVKTVILIGLIEFAKGTQLWLWVVAGAFILGRVLHAFGMDGWMPGRMIGIATTMLTMIGLGIYAALIPYLG